MKTKILNVICVLICAALYSQSKVDMKKDDLKFYFPKSSYNSAAEFHKNLPDLVQKIAPYEIDDSAKKYSGNAVVVYLLQNKFDEIIKFPSEKQDVNIHIPIKSYAMAIKADPAKGNQYKKIFTDNFLKDFSPLDDREKSKIANSYFDDWTTSSTTEMMKILVQKLKAKNTDSISYDDAIMLLNLNVGNALNSDLKNFRDDLVKDYIIQYSQPLIKGSPFMSVLIPTEVTALPDLTIDRKLLFEIVDFSTKDTKTIAHKNENFALIEVARILNLNIASGVPPEKLKVAVVFHGPASKILLNNETYRKDYNIDNPNISLIKQMQSKGVEFVLCGQFMAWQGWKTSNLIDGVKKAFSAMTAIEDFQNRGYIFQKIEEFDPN